MSKEYTSFSDGAELLALLEENGPTLKGGLRYIEEVPSDSHDGCGEYAVTGRFTITAAMSDGEKLALFQPGLLEKATFNQHFNGGVISPEVTALDGLGYVLIRR